MQSETDPCEEKGPCSHPRTVDSGLLRIELFGTLKQPVPITDRLFL